MGATQQDRFAIETLETRMTQYYAVQEPACIEGAPVVFALHGFAQRCGSFLHQLRPLGERGILSVAPQGPHQFYLDLASKQVGCTWLTNLDKATAIQDFVGYMETLYEQITKKYPTAAPGVFVLGFSQGVSMAYRLAVSGRLSIRGVVACNADLAPDAVEKLGSVDPFPVLLVHGKQDGITPLEKSEAAGEILERHGFEVTRLYHEGGHELSAEVVGQIGDWVMRVG